MVLRPADGVETALCWSMALRRKDGPTALLLTRQNVPTIEREKEFKHTDIAKGGYIIKKENKFIAQVAIIASGSEVGKALEAAELLEDENIPTRVISIPCKEIFDSQHEEYLSEILPDSLKLTAIVEAGTSFGWNTYFNIPQVKITIDDYGVSGPYKELEEKFGLTGELIAERIIKYLE
jgi:transketolase